ncbi:protein app1-like [Sorghum bicolor]|uniref:protein app1-like n=1 Tax=Sorghum bicolor TaxID=4558 RepID=UPI000B4249B1|nr:protein app1-like [Sorghum bicolor]|eukprot:XP_021319192.1 protein app1-like [Sorghum bicolor]
MPPVTRSRRASTRNYISQFTPQSSQPVEDISDDETVPMDEEDPAMMTEVDDDDENWMDSLVAAAPVPPTAPTPPIVPVAPIAPTPPASPVAPAAPVVPEVVSPDGPEEEDPG